LTIGSKILLQKETKAMKLNFFLPLFASLSFVEIRFPFFGAMWGEMIWAAEHHPLPNLTGQGKVAALPKSSPFHPQMQLMLFARIRNVIP
jgi:hypothetical protein